MLDKPQSWSNPTPCLPPHLQMCSSMAKENHKIILMDFPSSSRSLSASSSFMLPSNHILLFWSIHLPSPRGPLTSSPWKVPLSSLSLDELLLIHREKGSDQNRITTHTMHLCTIDTHLTWIYTQMTSYCYRWIGCTQYLEKPTFVPLDPVQSYLLMDILLQNLPFCFCIVCRSRKDHAYQHTHCFSYLKHTHTHPSLDYGSHHLTLISLSIIT